MKEEEYKKLRCCGPAPYNTGNRNQEAFDQVAGVGELIPIRDYCSGSECGAWVWENPIQGHPQDAGKYGYCGLIKC